MNCSLSPNDTLGRMLHTFSCTAYEIASYDDKTLLNMGLTGSNELAAERAVEYITTEELLPYLINYSGEDEWTDNILDSTRKPTNIKFYNMVAGDKIKLITKDSEQVIIIGATGAYAAEGLTQINMIKLHKNNAKVQGMLTYNYVEKLTNEFGLYKRVSNKEIPIRQFIGGVDSVATNIRKQIEDIKTELINLHYIQIEKRPVEYVYAEDKNNLTLDKIYLDKYKTQPLSSAKLNPCTVYFIRDASVFETGDNLGYYNDWNLTGELIPAQGAYEYEWDYEEKFPLITTTIGEVEESLFIDGNDKQKNIYTGDKYNTKFYFTKETSDTVVKSETETINYDLGVDLAEKEFFRIEDFEPENIFIGSGLILTMGYSSIVYEYNFENNKEYKKAITDYQALEEKYFTEGNVSFEELEESRLKILSEYKKVLLYIEENIEQYKKEHGLDE